jgi:uncharacterized protein YceK
MLLSPLMRRYIEGEREDQANMTKVRMMLWVLAVLVLVGFVAAGCGSASDQTEPQDKKKVEAKGHQAKQEAKNKLKSKGQQAKQKATQKANASKLEAENKLKARGERAKQKAKQKRGSRPGSSKKSKGY